MMLTLGIIALSGCASSHDPSWPYVKADTSDAARQEDYKECEAEAKNVLVALVCTYCQAGEIHGCMMNKGYKQQQITR